MISDRDVWAAALLSMDQGEMTAFLRDDPATGVESLAGIESSLPKWEAAADVTKLAIERLRFVSRSDGPGARPAVLAALACDDSPDTGVRETAHSFSASTLVPRRGAGPKLTKLHCPALTGGAFVSAVLAAPLIGSMH